MEEEKKSKLNLKAGTGVMLVIGLVIGLIIGMIVMYFVKPSRVIAKLNGATITEKQIYNKLEKYYSSDVLSTVLEEVDDAILSKKYKVNDKMEEEIKEEADQYIEAYMNYYGETQEEFLEQCGFENYDDFKNYISLEYKRNLYYYDYLAGVIGNEKIKEYYDANNFGKIGVKHILVKTSDEVPAETAQNMAKEIITKLDEGANFDELGQQYLEENADTIVVEDLGYLTFADSIEEAFMEAVKSMEDNTYSKEPVETSYGYHIIYRTDKKDLSLEDARNDIINVLYTDVEAKSKTEKLIELRNESGLKFKIEKFKTEYDKLCESYQ